MGDRMKAPSWLSGDSSDDDDDDMGGDYRDDDEDEGGGDGPPPDFKAHAMVALDERAEPNDRVQALYDAIMCCAGGDAPHGKGGLDVIIGLGGKPKKDRG